MAAFAGLSADTRHEMPTVTRAQVLFDGNFLHALHLAKCVCSRCPLFLANQSESCL